MKHTFKVKDEDGNVVWNGIVNTIEELQEELEEVRNFFENGNFTFVIEPA